MHCGILAVSNIVVCVLSIYIYSKFTLEDMKLLGKEWISNNSNESMLTMHWCFGQQSKICHFQSLCYYPFEDQFVYMIDSSAINEVKSSFHSLSFSSVNELDVFSFVPVFLHQNSTRLNIRWIHGNVILFKRFKPDNLMHVLHDDVLPLYHTIKLLGHEDLKLLFMDDHSQEPYDSLYKIFADVKYKPSGKKQEFLCFKSAFIGVSSVSKWYQYGYHGNVQGPVSNEELTAFYLQTAANSIASKLKCAKNSDNQHMSVKDYLVLISRTETRKILNEEELISQLKLITKMNILVISDNDLSEIVCTVMMSRGIIGMHGASLILGLFLKPGSILMELFPYAINPDNYTPYHTLADIPGMSIIYRSWRNMKKEHSLAHPEYSPEGGGIKHLSEEIQAEIMDQIEVPLHSCCSDPSFLFHINQDTIVDVEKVSEITLDALTESQQKDKTDRKSVSFSEPSVVKQLHCSCIDNKLSLSWERPWNIDFVNDDVIHYKIGIQSRMLKTYKVYVVNGYSYTLEDEIDCFDTYDIWINAEKNGIQGVVKYIEC